MSQRKHVGSIGSGTVRRLRERYALLRALTPMDREQFDAAVAELVGVVQEPGAFVAAAEEVAKSVVNTCGRCAGTGRFITMVVNGQPTGPGGACFRCQGHGHQTAADRERNYWYDVASMNRAARAMIGGN